MVLGLALGGAVLLSPGTAHAANLVIVSPSVITQSAVLDLSGSALGSGTYTVQWSNTPGSPNHFLTNITVDAALDDVSIQTPVAWRYPGVFLSVAAGANCDPCYDYLAGVNLAISPTLTLSIGTAAPGQGVQVVGTGYGAGLDSAFIPIAWGCPVPVQSDCATANAFVSIQVGVGGDFSTSFPVPTAPDGFYAVSAGYIGGASPVGGAVTTLHVVNPTAAAVSQLVMRAGVLSWRVATNRGILGFNVLAGGMQVNGHLIAAHAGRTYRYAVGAIAGRAIQVETVYSSGRTDAEAVDWG